MLQVSVLCKGQGNAAVLAIGKSVPTFACVGFYCQLVHYVLLAIKKRPVFLFFHKKSKRVEQLHTLSLEQRQASSLCSKYVY